MKLPSRAVIGHRNYTLEIWPVLEARVEEARGVHYSHTNSIKIADDLSPADAGEVGIHEILHACWRGLPTGDEERIVTTLAENLAQVFADNPDLIAWIQHNLRRPDGCATAALRMRKALKVLPPKNKVSVRSKR